MSGNITFNPYATSQPSNTFLGQTQGYVQGSMMDDPAVRMEITAGYLLGTQTVPVWGGTTIQEYVNITGAGAIGLGSAVLRSTSVATISGWAINNQNASMVITPGSTVPLAGANNDVHYVRTGTNARIAVQCSSALTSSLASGSTSQQVSWDFVNQLLIPYQASYNSASVASATYTSSTGILAVTFSAAPASTTPTVGATFSISGMTTSAGSAAAINGDFALVSSGSSGTILNFNIGIGLGTITINSATGTLAAGGGAAPCRVLSINSNSKIVSPYVSGSPLLWTSGTAAIILI